MSIWWILTIILGVVSVITFVWAMIGENELVGYIFLICFLVLAIVLIVSISQSISVKKEMIRQEKEREQIIYQIEHLSVDSDKIKLNEWILTYNDWVNDVNTSKEMYGVFSWYHSVDMSEHTIINLV